MKSPQLEDGYTRIANEILEAMCRNPEILTGALFPVIGVIMRKTYGWNKKQDAIAISQFTEMTGYSRRSIIYAIQQLEAKNVIKVQRGCHGLQKDTNIYSFNKNYKEWVVQNSAPQVESNRGSAKLRKKVVQNSVKNVQSFAPTKDTTKEITKDTTAPSAESELKANNQDMGFNKYADDFEEELQIDPDHAPKPKAKKKVADEIQQVFDLFDNPAKAIWRLREIERESAKALFEIYGIETLKKRIARIEVEKKLNEGDNFFPLINAPSHLLDKMESVERYLKI